MTIFHAVIVRLDWMRAVSVLRKALANDETKYGVVKGVEFKKRSVILRWLAVAKALLDTVLSVTSSVIVSKLLMSGDVEKNPGPGGRWIIATYRTIFSQHRALALLFFLQS